MIWFFIFTVFAFIHIDSKIKDVKEQLNSIEDKLIKIIDPHDIEGEEYCS